MYRMVCINFRYVSAFIIGHSGDVCFECIKQLLAKLISLQEKLCTSNHNKVSFCRGFLWTSEVSSEEVARISVREWKVFHVLRPLPTNVDMMRQHNYQYKFKHTYYDCRFMGTFTGCFHPHNLEEDRQWNQWKSEGLTPVKLHDSAVAEYEKCKLTVFGS